VRAKKLFVTAGGILVAVVAAVAVAVSLLVNIDRFRPQLARAMSAALGREVAMRRISLSLLSAGAVVEDLSIGDDPAFSREPFVTAREVRVGIALVPLMTSKHLRIESLRLLEPRVTLRRSAAGSWNFATLGGSSSTPASASSSSSSGLTMSIDRLRIAGGQVVVESPAPRPSRSVYDGLEVDVRDVSSASRFPFSIALSTPGGGTVKAAGHIGPMGPAGIGSTPFEAALDGAGVDIARAGVVDSGAGLGGTLDVHLRAASNGARINASGTLRGQRLQLVPGASGAQAPVEVAFASDYDLATHEGIVKQGDLRTGSAVAHVRGRFNTHDFTPILQLALAGKAMPATDLQALLPAIGAALPRGSRFRSGTLDADLTARGRLDHLAIAGPLALSDATLTGFDLGERMRAIASLAGYRGGAETTIQTLSVMLRIAPEGMIADGLTCIVPALGHLNGSGTVAPNGALNFRMLASLNRTGGMLGQVTKMTSFGRPDAGIPFRITGTTTAPVFVPDAGRVASAAVKDPGTMAKAAGFMKSLFGHK